ncbi:hypothetical protein [Polyangium spumosum]|uniref:hypothetical protein n=1 Tax=Polyangium spumosum TaxID=889282 RepID=UPI001F0FC83A|nr:hypothetical protein [Polyangium spumosum]
MNIVTLSIPAFFLLMGLEWLAGRVKDRRVFRGPDVLANLLLGSAQTLFGVVAAGLLLGSYLLLYERRFFDVSPRSASRPPCSPRPSGSIRSISSGFIPSSSASSGPSNGC